MKYRIVELEREDTSIIYVLEREEGNGEWFSVWRNEDLDEVRAAKKKREGRDVVKRRVIE